MIVIAREVLFGCAKKGGNVTAVPWTIAWLIAAVVLDPVLPTGTSGQYAVVLHSTVPLCLCVVALLRVGSTGCVLGASLAPLHHCTTHTHCALLLLLHCLDNQPWILAISPLRVRAPSAGGQQQLPQPSLLRSVAYLPPSESPSYIIFLCELAPSSQNRIFSRLGIGGGTVQMNFSSSNLQEATQL